MVVAIVLLKVERKRVNEIAEVLSEVGGVAEVYSVSGRYDLVTIIRSKDNEALSDVVTNHMLKVDGIVDSETMLAFRGFSRHDLESMFSIGA
ncbi:MAG: Lrp/AsnC family transcriptional regulator [Chitinivibrionales bacterium]|nr:Lrp/AsnC family transcriptional regulator [Chitinivibrionales bacterium]MBD3358992.1 Lrp/AsnC family transcriptional regulator [Chitinivibrionales bacterium]